MEEQKNGLKPENWGGKREGAGRPLTGRSKKVIYVTDSEYNRIIQWIWKNRQKSPT